MIDKILSIRNGQLVKDTSNAQLNDNGDRLLYIGESKRGEYPLKLKQSIANYNCMGNAGWDRLSIKAEEFAQKHNLYFGERNNNLRLLPCDIFPLMISQQKFTQLSDLLCKHAQLLRLIYVDFYGQQKSLAKIEQLSHLYGAIKPIFSCSTNVQKCKFIFGFDVTYDVTGNWRILEVNTEFPSGFLHIWHNRLFSQEFLPQTSTKQTIDQLDLHNRFNRLFAPYSQVQIAHAGAHSNTWREIEWLQSHFGWSQQIAKSNHQWGLDAIYRRANAKYFSKSFNFPPTLEQIINPLNSGILGNKALLAYLPQLAKLLLGQSSQAWCDSSVGWCADGQQVNLQKLQSKFSQYVIKSCYGRGGQGVFFPMQQNTAEQAKLISMLTAEPKQFVIQPYYQSMQTPVYTQGKWQSRVFDIRVMVLLGEQIEVIPSALVRYPANSELSSNTSLGGGVKDLWII